MGYSSNEHSNFYDMQLLIEDSHLFLFMGVHILRACMQCPQRAPETGVKDGPESPGVWRWEPNSLCSALLSRLRPLLYAAFF